MLKRYLREVIRPVQRLSFHHRSLRRLHVVLQCLVVFAAGAAGVGMDDDLGDARDVVEVELHESHLTARNHRQLRQIAVPSHGSNFMHLSLPIGSDSIIHDIAVPSHGSNFMHPPGLLRWPARLRALQYPHTGRTSCIPRTSSSVKAGPSYCSTLTRVELHASAS